ncbi:MAG: hypothetical protein AAF222_07635 [Pseudomonadota bacterium]
MANLSDAFEVPKWRRDKKNETPKVTGLVPPKYCITEMSAAGLIAIALGLSLGLWLAIAAVI